MKNKSKVKGSKPKAPKLPKALSADKASGYLAHFNETPADFWLGVESTWDWVALRRGGKLQERMKALDAHFLALSKTHRICPVVLLLNRGAKQ